MRFEDPTSPPPPIYCSKALVPLASSDGGDVFGSPTSVLFVHLTFSAITFFMDYWTVVWWLKFVSLCFTLESRKTLNIYRVVKTSCLKLAIDVYVFRLFESILLAALGAMEETLSHRDILCHNPGRIRSSQSCGLDSFDRILLEIFSIVGRHGHWDFEYHLANIPTVHGQL